MRPALATISHVVEFAEDIGIGPVLRCPRCGDNYLHQARVTVFDREEDAELTAVTTVAAGLAATHLLPSDQIANPSRRRQGLAIAFDCEGCADGIELTIAQHKGTTVFAWRCAPCLPPASEPAIPWSEGAIP
jgi:hypothetical protein